MMKSIITEQPRIQLKHYHVESFWNKVAAEMNENLPGIVLIHCLAIAYFLAIFLEKLDKAWQLIQQSLRLIESK